MASEEAADSTNASASEEEEDSEPTFSEDEAMRALTVACSNGIWSVDAYADEGDDVDESTAPIGVYGALIEDEMHPYDDSQSGSYLYGSNYDDCYAVDSNTWHIEGLTLESYENYLLTNYTFEVSGDVSFDGENYWVSNVTMEYEYFTYDEDGNIDIWGGTYEGTWCENEFSDKPFKVSPSLIADED